MGRGANGPIGYERRREASAAESMAVFTLDEVAKHASEKDAWIVIRDGVYDISEWVDHPGGKVLFSAAGTDATDTFAAFHPPEASKTLAKFRIGSLKAEASPSDEYVREYRELRNKFRQMGLFQASPLYYVYKVASNVAILSLAVWVLANSGSSFWMQTLSATLMALFWQQCGWLAHDFLHHQVFKNRFYGDLMGYLVGNAFQGFSVDWWKNKHNTHHSVPNLHNGDPDIDTAPILAWSNSIAARHKDSTMGRILIKLQPFLYFPILTIARVSWAYQSLMWSIQTPMAPLRKSLELLGMFVHYSFLFTIMYWYLTPAGAVWYFVFSQCLCGLLLALVFGLGHNGMSVFDEHPEDFFRFQVLSTRDIIPTPFVSWFMGGLEYQIEHHLFPTIPRHNLPQTKEFVHDFCNKHNIPYHTTTFLYGTVEVLQCLFDISKSI